MFTDLTSGARPPARWTNGIAVAGVREAEVMSPEGAQFTWGSPAGEGAATADGRVVPGSLCFGGAAGLFVELEIGMDLGFEGHQRDLLR